MEKNIRYQRGLEKLGELTGAEGEEIVASLGDLGKYIAEFAFGDVYSREGLSQRERKIATLAMLTVLGRTPQLRVHMNAALNLGLSQEDVEEIIIQTVPYAGFPTAMDAYDILKELRAEDHDKNIK